MYAIVETLQDRRQTLFRGTWDNCLSYVRFCAHALSVTSTGVVRQMVDGSIGYWTFEPIEPVDLTT